MSAYAHARITINGIDFADPFADAAPEPTPATPAPAMTATETVLQATEDAAIRQAMVAALARTPADFSTTEAARVAELMKPRRVCGICGRADCGSVDRWDREVSP